MSKRLPPYGRDIQQRRDSGDHPPKIWVIFGDDWNRRPENAICVHPGEYQAGIYNWSVCAGVPTHVVERTRVIEPTRDAVRLACEVALATAPVVLHWIAGTDDWPMIGKTHSDISDLMAYAIPTLGVSMPERSRHAPSMHRRSRPKWWTAKIEKQYRQRRTLYFTVLRNALVRRYAGAAA